jgi:hypothetical protein
MSETERQIPEMTLAESYASIQMIARLALNVPVDCAQAVVAQMEHTDVIMPLLDPTGWIKISRTAPAHRKLARAFLAFRRELAVLLESEAP